MMNLITRNFKYNNSLSSYSRTDVKTRTYSTEVNNDLINLDERFKGLIENKQSVNTRKSVLLSTHALVDLDSFKQQIGDNLHGANVIYIKASLKDSQHKMVGDQTTFKYIDLIM